MKMKVFVFEDEKTVEINIECNLSRSKAGTESCKASDA